MKGSLLASRREGTATKLLFCVLVLCLLNGCEQFTSQSNQKDASTQSDVIAQPSLTASTGLYATYARLERTVLEGALPTLSLASFEVFISDEAKLRQVDSLLMEARNPDRTRSQKAFRALYAVLAAAQPKDDLLFDYLSNSLEQISTDVSDSPKSRTRSYAWAASYLLDSALTAYEGTKQVRFLDISRIAMLEMLKNRDDVHNLHDSVRGRVLKAWGGYHFNREKTYTSVVTHAGRIAMPMARYAWIVSNTQGLPQEHFEAADVLLVAARTAILEYEDEFVVNDDKDIGYYVRKIADRIEPLNHQTSVGEALIYLALLDDDGSWSRRARLLSNFVKAAIYKQQNGTVSWDYDPTADLFRGARPDPIWKAQVTIRFMIHAECHGIAFTPSDLQEVAHSFLTNVVRQEGINSSFSSEFQTMQRYENRYGGYKNIVPFIMLGKYDPKVEEKITKMIASDSRFEGWFGEPKSSISYAYRLSKAGTSCFSRNSMTPRFDMGKIPVIQTKLSAHR